MTSVPDKEGENAVWATRDYVCVVGLCVCLWVVCLPVGCVFVCRLTFVAVSKLCKVSTDTGAFKDAITAFHRLIDLKEKYYDVEVWVW